MDTEAYSRIGSMFQSTEAPSRIFPPADGCRTPSPERGNYKKRSIASAQRQAFSYREGVSMNSFYKVIKSAAMPCQAHTAIFLVKSGLFGVRIKE